MGKRAGAVVASQASKKISTKDDKKQLSNLIKVLRPKVYITDSSSFKTLVQHLTGNENHLHIPIPIPIPVSSSSNPPPPKVDDDNNNIVQADVTTIHHHHQDQHQIFQESTTSLELSLVDDSPQLSLPTSFTALESSPERRSIPGPFSTTTSASDQSSLFTNHLIDFSQFRDIESWLLEVDQFPNYYYDGYADPSAHQEVEVGVYDYELSGLI